MNTIFVAIPSYTDPDLPATLDSAIRMSSGRNVVHLAVCEQVTRYAAAYLMGRDLPEHVFVSVEQVGDRLIGIGGARHLAESFYGGEDLQVQTDSHARFDSDWDVQIVNLCDRLGDGVSSANMMPDPWSYAGRIPVVRYERSTNGIPAGHVEMIEPPVRSAIRVDSFPRDCGRRRGRARLVRRRTGRPAHHVRRGRTGARRATLHHRPRSLLRADAVPHRDAGRAATESSVGTPRVGGDGRP